MANNYTDAMEEDEIELSLGLSIGGSGTLRKSKNPKSVACSIDMNTDVKESDSGSSVSTRFDDRQTKREIEALRRLGEEARRKRKLEAGRAMRREKEDGVAEPERACKREKLEAHDTSNMNENQQYPMGPMQFQYVPVQYVALGNGFAFPYVMPCWMPGSQKNSVHPLFQAYGNCDSEQNSRKDDGDGDGDGKPTSNHSPGCSSSVISDNRSLQLQGSSSSDCGSDSSHSKSSKSQLNASTGSDDHTQGYSEHSASSHPMESSQGIDKETNYTKKMVSSNIAQSSNTKPKAEASSETKPNRINKTSPLKESKGEIGKPPNTQTQNHGTTSLSQMPCVSTTGNGPNGKTITGFLYRYTKTEVSIVCVCHGTSFSPAEFVEHAGGIDVSHPLKHITVVPSAFG